MWASRLRAGCMSQLRGSWWCIVDLVGKRRSAPRNIAESRACAKRRELFVGVTLFRFKRCGAWDPPTGPAARESALQETPPNSLVAALHIRDAFHRRAQCLNEEMARRCDAEGMRMPEGMRKTGR